MPMTRLDEKLTTSEIEDRVLRALGGTSSPVRMKGTGP